MANGVRAGAGLGVHLALVARLQRQASRRVGTSGADTVHRDQVCDWLATLPRGLRVAHEAGFVHQDVKPANVVLAQERRPVLVDFGLAQMRDAGTEHTIGSALTKLHATQAAGRAAEQAVLLPGGRGSSGAYPVERCLRDSFDLRSHEGTSRIQMSTLARAVG